MRGKLGVVVLVVTMAAPVHAGLVVPDRATLNALLGPSAVTENFQGINLGGTGSVDVAAPFNSSTLIPASDHFRGQMARRSFLV